MFIKNLGRENVFFKEKGKVFKKNLAKEEVFNKTWEEKFVIKECAHRTLRRDFLTYLSDHALDETYTWMMMVLMRPIPG